LFARPLRVAGFVNGFASHLTTRCDAELGAVIIALAVGTDWSWFVCCGGKCGTFARSTGEWDAEIFAALE